MSAYILYTLLAIFVLIVLTVLIRTFMMKPSPAVGVAVLADVGFIMNVRMRTVSTIRTKMARSV